MASRRGRLEYSDDLTPGQSKDGGLHQNLYDSQGRLVGHATFIPDDEDGDDDSLTDPPPVFFDANTHEPDPQTKERLELEELLEAVVLLVRVIKAAEKAAPHLKRWWNDQALPLMKSTRNKLARTRKAGRQATPTESTTSSGPAPTETSQDVTDAHEKHRSSMSSTEARERFTAALIARLFSEEQLMILRNSRIENDPLELGATETLTLQQAEDRIKLALEKNPSLLNEDKLTELGKALVDGGHIPLRNENQTLRLTDGSS
ncbi:hypothetical protein [Streptomyces sp. NPDC001833]|uniref:hypothetical protein n=1 Tax=Streptomyces sp. NPDC001833 TaxID=3154658 RepID=UPI0033300926